ncbi:MAG TPA: hypothetical protein PLN31_17265 [Azoarcus taiwanensis]|nr:hypothetical protein [Azoarcus taiwanensis]
MGLITLIRRRIRIARLQDAIYRRNILRTAYAEQMGGLRRQIDALEAAHRRDITTRGPSSRDIERGVALKAKRTLLQGAA